MENLSRQWNHTPDPKGHRASGVPAGDRGARLPFINCAKMWPTGGGRAKDDPQNQRGIEVGTNYLLACLDSKDLHQLKSHLVTATVNRGEVLAEWDQQPERIWFPVTCVVSLVVAMNAGNDVTVGLIGREGATDLRFGRQIVLLPGSARFLPIDTKQTAPDIFPALRQLLLRHAGRLTWAGRAVGCVQCPPLA